MAYMPPQGGRQADITAKPTAAIRWGPVQAPTTDGTGYTRTLIIGQSGFGKTRLAATWPDPFFLDYDHGAGSANVRRLLMPRDTTSIPALEAFTAAARGGKLVDGAWQHRAPNGEDVAYRTLVIDTLDSCQQPAKQHLLAGRLQMEKRDWGKLADWLRPALEPLMALPCHIVLVCHQTKSTPMRKDEIGYIGMAVQGSLKEALLGWSDLVLNMVGDRAGERRLYVAPVITVLLGQQYEILAKDRHGWFNDVEGVRSNGCFTWAKSPGGYPSNKLAGHIVGHGITAEPVEVLPTVAEPPPAPEEGAEE